MTGRNYAKATSVGNYGELCDSQLHSIAVVARSCQRKSVTWTKWHLSADEVTALYQYAKPEGLGHWHKPSNTLTTLPATATRSGLPLPFKSPSATALALTE